VGGEGGSKVAVGVQSSVTPLPLLMQVFIRKSPEITLNKKIVDAKFDRLTNHPDARSHVNQRGLVLPIVPLQSEAVQGRRSVGPSETSEVCFKPGHRRLSYGHAECVLVARMSLRMSTSTRYEWSTACRYARFCASGRGSNREQHLRNQRETC
jgi:hypothetical protein